MSASRPDTSSALQPIGSDLEKVDAYINSEADYDELPEITDEEFARSVARINGEDIGEALVTEPASSSSTREGNAAGSQAKSKRGTR